MNNCEDSLPAAAAQPFSRNEARRSRAAPRSRRRSCASPSHALSAPARACGSAGGTRRPGTVPQSPRPIVAGTPPTSEAMTGMPRARASVMTMP